MIRIIIIDDNKSIVMVWVVSGGGMVWLVLSMVVVIQFFILQPVFQFIKSFMTVELQNSFRKYVSSVP